MRLAYHDAAAYGRPHSSLAAKLAALLNRAMTMPRLWSRRRHDRRTLVQLDDHMLRDIGLDRSRADEMASRPFWRA